MARIQYPNFGRGKLSMVEAGCERYIESYDLSFSGDLSHDVCFVFESFMFPFISMYKTNYNPLLYNDSLTKIAYRLLSNKRRPTFDYYKILGLKRDASLKEIKQAYYDKSKQYHPDLNSSKDAAKKFREVNIAYEALTNERAIASGNRKQPTQPSSKTYESKVNDFSDFQDNMAAMRFKRRSVYQARTDVFSYNKENSSKNLDGSTEWLRYKQNYDFHQNMSKHKDYKEYSDSSENIKAKERGDYSATIATLFMVIIIYGLISELKFEGQDVKRPKQD